MKDKELLANALYEELLDLKNANRRLQSNVSVIMPDRGTGVLFHTQ